ncbi:uncharacterized protein N7496_007609 [Penicillium cataractarum]|uniref:Methyltransferase domain-containing protein n=1 Tax=Penicillium cataractarum TaxID=2100454 RepID=A0A9W9V7E1_9EURO|nr:uncharacterized protein N7496_007609 [Penicillium cataractarum]KAJ5371517.1 hypothetical protein N7496_007609 [Penicillium cataractarum]
MASHRTHTRVTGAPDYDNPHFWDARFATGQDVGEWLNSGEALIDAVLADLEHRSSFDAQTPRVLHLGPGVSKLGLKLRRACVQRQWKARGIVNVDFSTEAVRLGQEAESQVPRDQAMTWYRADLLSWDDVSGVTQFAPFDVIFDKSTSDAIATFDDQIFTATDDMSRVCPLVKDILSQQSSTALSPVDLLALHLVPLSRKDTTWVVLSYSSLRFDKRPILDKYWSLRSRIPVKAPAGPVSTSAYTPEVFHWLYILDRK